MKTITFGDSNSRYALIFMKVNRENNNPYDNTVSFVYSNNLKELDELMQDLINLPFNSEFKLDIDIFDYKKCVYVKHY